MSLITIKTFDNSGEAHVLKAKLESEGVECYLFDENIISLNPLYNVMMGGIKLKINEVDFEKAKKIITEINNIPITNGNNEILKCPNCASTELISGFKSMKGVKGIFSIIISFIFAIFPIYYKTVYKCKKCDAEFKQAK